MAIPKNIIYIWVGGKEKPQKVLDCMETWKKHMPDWKYIEINDNTFDISENKYCQDAYNNKAWAYVSDYLRLKALYEYGGIYMDVDVICYKSLDKFLNHKFFTGFEQTHYPVTATMGSEKGNKLIKEMLDIYNTKKFSMHENWGDYETNTMILSDILGKYFDRNKMEYQDNNNHVIYPRKTFCYNEVVDDEVYTRHLMFGSWVETSNEKQGES